MEGLNPSIDQTSIVEHQSLDEEKISRSTTMEIFDKDDMEELNEIINLVKTNNIEGMSEILLSSNRLDSNGRGYNEFQCIASKQYLNRKELITCVHNWAAKLGFVTVIKTSKRDCIVVIGCDRGGKYRANKVPKKYRDKTRSMTGTRLVGCPFEVVGKYVKYENFWKVEIKDLSHNHEASSDLLGHPFFRRFSNEEVVKIKELTEAGIARRQILTSLRGNNSNVKAIARSVYNARAKIRKERLSDRTMIQALVEELGDGEFLFDMNQDKKGHVTHLFLAHPSSIALTKSYSTVFLMDCTYKTNKYKMTLLNIVGVTSFNGTFFSCFAFLRKEQTVDYVWALENFSKVLGPSMHPSVILTDRELALMNAIKIVFPNSTNLPCVWHIENNILGNCKKHFKEKKEWDDFMVNWIDVVKSDDESSFENTWGLFADQYKEKIDVISYIEDTWLPWKDRFIYAWTEKLLHFGHHVTSRVEGAHSKLKKFLQVSIGDFCGIKDKM